MNSGNKQMLNVAYQDLCDISKEYERLELEFRFVANNGDRILVNGFLPNQPRVREVNGIQNHVLIEKYSKLLENKPSKDDFFKHFKHLNDMSPEEYAWCEGIE